VKLELTDTEVIWELVGPDGSLDLRAKRTRGGLLHAPLTKDMHQRVEETMDSSVRITLRDTNNKIVCEGIGQAAALEVFGDLDRLLAYGK
jgi:hypothetical protein